MKHLQIKVTGLVQGVFFRKHTCEQALRMDLTGFVKNLPDNSVYIEVVGMPEKLEKFVQWCYIGSPKSKVEKVLLSENPTVENFNGFIIK